MEKDIILFTGQSGIKIEKCLEKAKKDITDLKIEIVKIENLMIKGYKKIYPEQSDYDNKTIITKILGLQPFLQRKLWDMAFKSAKQIFGVNDEKKMYFLSFHACFYHQKNREFLSPINLGNLERIKKRVKMIIVFVDDCYDIYKRLLSDGEMFYEDVMAELVKPEKAVFKSVWNLLTILSWREVEIAFSRKISEILKVPLYIFAVKHPCFMIQRLILNHLEKLQIFYLAHPISSIRRRDFARTAKFPEEINIFAERCLDKKKNSILFIPDTIDELRIKKEDNFYRPELSAGWSLPFKESDWIYQALPENLERINPLNPKNFQISETKAKNTFSPLIEILSEKIGEQITSRDYGLVEQSKDGVIIYKPYWDGDISEGAVRETDYNIELRKFKKENRKIFVFEEEENLSKYRIVELFDSLVNSLKKVDKSTKDNLNKLKEKWKNDKSIYTEFFKGKLTVSKIRTEIKKVLPNNYDFSEKFFQSHKSTLRGAPMLEKEERLSCCWKALYDNIINLDHFKNKCIDPREEYFLIPSHKFDNKIDYVLNKIFHKKRKEGFDEQEKKK